MRDPRRALNPRTVFGLGGAVLSATAALVGLLHSLVLLGEPLRDDLLRIQRGQWGLVAASAGVFLAFLVLLPVRVRRDWRGHGLYAAFVVSLFAEMFGFPLTAYLLSSAVGWTLFERGFMGYSLRHPQYLGLILVTAGWLVHWPTVPGLLMWPLLTAAYVRQARKEEQELRSRFGALYEEYARRTPPWIPRYVFPGRPANA